MSPGKSLVLALSVCLCALPAAAGGLKDLLKAAKQKAGEVVQGEVADKSAPSKEVPTPDQAAVPELASTPSASAAAQGKTSVPSQPSSKPAAQTGVAGKKEKALWPNIAIDADVVKKQQLAYGKECRERHSDDPTIDCGCMESRYPEARLQTLSEDTRDAEKRMGFVCKSGAAGCEEPDAVMFRWITEPKTQKNYPTVEGLTQRPRFFTYHVAQSNMFESVTLQVGEQCRNTQYIGAQAEQQCLQHVKSGLTPLKPGTSTKAYCACVGEKYAAREANAESQCAAQ
ncbi:MAG TPA: hypothetical protein VGO53_05380 [Steroidobacteraceae bacterium]|jgi:hypothetical protein|nr:hypothetical protein [Steroidobacteraceae bacterium]